jgi:hypothetical protein
MLRSILCLFLLLALSTCTAQTAPNDFKKLEWLLGNWRGQANGAYFYESWERVSGAELSNINYSLCDGQAVISERGAIRLQGGEIVAGGGKDLWKLTRLTDDEAVFENPAIGYAQKITHRLTPEGAWHARIEGKQGVIEYTLTRVALLAELTKQKPQPIVGRFTGAVEAGEKRVPVIFDFDSHEGRQRILISSPDKSRTNIPAERVCYDPPQLRFSVDDGGRKLDFVTEYSGDAITGKVVNDQTAATLRLKRENVAPSTPKVVQ